MIVDSRLTASVIKAVIKGNPPVLVHPRLHLPVDYLKVHIKNKIH